MTHMTDTPQTFKNDALIDALELLKAAGKIEMEINNDGPWDTYSFRFLDSKSEHLWNHFRAYVTLSLNKCWLSFDHTYSQRDGSSKRSFRQGLKLENRIIRLAAKLSK